MRHLVDQMVGELVHLFLLLRRIDRQEDLGDMALGLGALGLDRLDRVVDLVLADRHGMAVAALHRAAPGGLRGDLRHQRVLVDVMVAQELVELVRRLVVHAGESGQLVLHVLVGDGDAFLLGLLHLQLLVDELAHHLRADALARLRIVGDVG